MKEFLCIYLAVIVGMSIVAFFAYMFDKRKAKNNKWRTKESVLLGLGVFGGAVGALLGMKCFRHKTKHWYFWAVNIVALLVHIAIPVVVWILVK
jgi:uncharacterized membrane protein YsdA (DUF1294 family)